MNRKVTGPVEETVLRKCIAAGCAKADQDRLVCRVFTDPAWFWRRGECPALSRDPLWEQEVVNAFAVYTVRLKQREEERKRRRGAW